MSDAASTAIEPPRSPDDGSSSPTGHLYRYVPVIAAVVYLLYCQTAPRVHTDSMGAILISTIISLSLLVWFPASFARAFHNPRALLLFTAAAIAINIPLRIILATGRPIWPWAWLFYVPGLPGLLFISLAAGLGGLLSYLVRSANMIPPIAAVLALVDIWTVLLGGPVQKIMQSETPAARAMTKAMTVRLPAPQKATAGASPLYIDVGFADFLFIAFFTAAICRFVPRPKTYRRTVWALIGILCAYMIVVFIREINLPALVPMAITMILMHWKEFRYERSEVFALLYAGLFVLLIGLGFWFLR